jgi:intein/homing endonuclease
MAKKYQIQRTFCPVNKVSAHILGWSWADGSINKEGDTFVLTSKDKEIALVRDYFYGDSRPLWNREDGIARLMIHSKKVVTELAGFGFNSQKSYNGSPVIPVGFERYFLLGLLDGDGCISVSTYNEQWRPVLRVFLCGNRESMEVIQQMLYSLFQIKFTIRDRKYYEKESVTILGRKVSCSDKFVVLDGHNTKENIRLLKELYSDIDGLPYLRRKHAIFQQFLNTYDPNLVCPLCGECFEQKASTHIYCSNCHILLRRLRNRRRDHFIRKGVEPSLTQLLSSKEQYINLSELRKIEENRRECWWQ